MSVWTTLLEAGSEMTVVTERVDRLRAEVDELHKSVTHNTERLIRIETLIDLARERQRQIPKKKCGMTGHEIIGDIGSNSALRRT